MRVARLPRLRCALLGLLPFGGRGGRARVEKCVCLGGRRHGRSPHMSLYESKTEVPFESVDAIDDVLLELGVEGWSLLQDVIVRKAWLVGIFAGEAVSVGRWNELEPLLKAAGVMIEAPEIRLLPDQDWRDSYKAHFKASQFGRLHWVPVWERERFTLPQGDVAIWLDPGLAFGTGNHETTRLCCERLVVLAEKAGDKIADWRVIDAGCGSGILALSAAKLGFKQVSGFDNDPEAVRVSLENAELNGLSGAVEFLTGDLVSGFAGRRQADVVLANIQADVLMRFVAELTGAVAAGGALVLSGILAVEMEKVREVFAAAVPGWKLDTRIMGEWSDIQLIRPF